MLHVPSYSNQMAFPTTGTSDVCAYRTTTTRQRNYDLLFSSSSSLLLSICLFSLNIHSKWLSRDWKFHKKQDQKLKKYEVCRCWSHVFFACKKCFCIWSSSTTSPFSSGVFLLQNCLGSQCHEAFRPSKGIAWQCGYLYFRLWWCYLEGKHRKS